MNNIYYLFANSIFQKDWQGAYKYLKEYLKLNNNKDCLLYSLLLEEILKFDNLDFSFIDGLSSFEEEETKGYTIYYNLTYNLVLEHDYDKALRMFKNYLEAEKEKNKNNELDSIIIEILLEEVTSNEFKLKQVLKEKMIHEQKENELKMKVLNFKYYFKQLQDNILNEKYEEAILSCKEILKYTKEINKKYYLNIINLLKTIINMTKNKQCLPKESMVYPNIEDYNFIFNLALKNGDYKTAYKNVGKCLYFNPTSNILKIYRSLLMTINNLDKMNSKRVTTVLTDDYLLNLVKEKKYANLKNILSKNLNSEKEPFYLDLLKLINIIDGISNEKLTFTKVNHEYSSDNPIDNFYEAMNIGDYEWAYKIIDIYLQTNKMADKKFIIYKYILSDLVDIMNKYQKSNDKLLKVKEYDYKIDCLLDEIIKVNGKDLTNCILELHLSLTNKANLLKENQAKLSVEEENLLHLIEAYINLNNYNVDFENSFKEIEKSDSVLDSFHKAMAFGDYKSAYDIINSNEWFNDKISNSKYYVVYRKILISLNGRLKGRGKANNLNDNDKQITVKNDYLELLANLKRLVKKREYNEAYKYLRENNFQNNCEFYEVMLKYLINLQTYENECETKGMVM